MRVWRSDADLFSITVMIDYDCVSNRRLRRKAAVAAVGVRLMVAVNTGIPEDLDFWHTAVELRYPGPRYRAFPLNCEQLE